MTTSSEPGAAPTRDRREIARLAAAAVVVVAFIVLAVIAIAASRSDFSFSAPASAEAPARAAARSMPAPPSLISLRQPSAAAATPVALPVVAAPAPVAPSPVVIEAPPVLPDEAVGKPCAAFGLPAPDKVGGLQSLILLVPLFGPFSPEAFAMMPAFEPGFHVLGPLFPLFELGLVQAEPILTALTPPAQLLGQAGFDALSPLYAGARPEVLDAEAQLAAFLQPIMQSLADTPGSECLIALEGLLASLAR